MPKPLPTHDKFLKQFISAAQIPSKQERGQVREQFKIKLAHHINMLQHHQLRQERVALAQQIAIQNQNDALHRTKHFLQLKQAKAQTNKSHSLLERSKKAEGDLARWERIVDRNREKYERELEQAKIVIKLWNDKLSQSCARKSTHLEGLSRNIKEKMEAKEKRIMTMRLKGELSPLNFNPEYFDVASPKHSSPTRKQTRISTESFLERRRRQEEEQLKQSIIRTVGKEERINQARYMRHYMQERRRKQHLDKEEFIRAMRDNNLTALRNNQEDRSQNIQRKLSRDPIREKHEYESPKRRARGSESVKAVFNAFGMEEGEGASLQSSPNRNYDRMMTEKLKDISSIMRKQKRLA